MPAEKGTTRNESLKDNTEKNWRKKNLVYSWNWNGIVVCSKNILYIFSSKYRKWKENIAGNSDSLTALQMWSKAGI